MIYKRHCILDLAQCARASTCPDTLLDACERPRANLDSTIALACSSLPATMHTFIVPSSSARSCRYAICLMCAEDRGARANENGLCWPAACRVHTLLSKRGIASKRWGRDALPCDHHTRAPKRGTMPRPPSVLAGGRWIAPHEHLDSSTSDLRPPRIHPPQQPARRTACTPCRLFALRAQVMSPRVRAPPCRSGRLRPPPPQRPRWTLAPPPPNSRKMACEVLFTLLQVFDRATW